MDAEGCSAMDLAMNMRNGANKCNLKELVDDSPFKGLKCKYFAGNELIAMLYGDTQAAKKDMILGWPRVPFAFVVITDKELLPLWLTNAIVGGIKNFRDSIDLLADNLNDLTKNFERLKKHFRSIRTWRHFIVLWTRWSLSAIVIGQAWDIVCHLCHFDVLAKVYETSMATWGEAGVHIAILYDE